MDVSWNGLYNRADIDIYAVKDDVLEFLNADKKTRDVLAGALKTVYRYVGPFQFCEGIPF
jgi:hypothetical protein